MIINTEENEYLVIPMNELLDELDKLQVELDVRYYKEESLDKILLINRIATIEQIIAYYKQFLMFSVIITED